MAAGTRLATRGQTLLSVLLLLLILAFAAATALEDVATTLNHVMRQHTLAAVASNPEHGAAAVSDDLALDSPGHLPSDGPSSEEAQQRAPSTGRGLQQILRAALKAAIMSPCPPAIAAVSGPGCSCTMYNEHSQPADQQDNAAAAAGGGLDTSPVRPLLFGSISSRLRSRKRNICPAGYRCSPSAAADIVRAGWQPNPDLSSSGVGNGSIFKALQSAMGMDTAPKGICVACQLGELMHTCSKHHCTVSS